MRVFCHILLTLLTCISISCGGPLTKSNGDLDNVRVEQHILQLEQTVSDLQSQFKVEQQKQAAVMSSVLSKLSSTTNELSKVNAKLEALEDEHNSTLTELARVSTELNALSGIERKYKTLRKDYDVIDGELTATKKDLNETTEELRNTKAELIPLQVKTNATLLDLVTFQQDEFRSVKQNVTAISKALEMLEVNLTSTSSDVQKQNLEISSTKEEVKTLKQQLEFTKTAQNNLTTKVTKIQADVQKTKKDITAIQVQSLNNTQSIQALSYMMTQLQTDVGYQVGLTSDTNVTDHQTLKFTNVSYNSGGGYCESSGIFTAPVSGTYMFWANVMTRDDGRLLIVWYRRGLEISRGYVPGGTTNNVVSIFTLSHLNKGDEVWLTTEESSVSKMLRGDNYSSYGGALLYAH